LKRPGAEWAADKAARKGGGYFRPRIDAVSRIMLNEAESVAEMTLCITPEHFFRDRCALIPSAKSRLD